MNAQPWKAGRLPASEHSLLKYVLEQTRAYHLWMVFKVIYIDLYLCFSPSRRATIENNLLGISPHVH